MSIKLRVFSSTSRLLQKLTGLKLSKGTYSISKKAAFEPPCTFATVIDGASAMEIGAFSIVGDRNSGVIRNVRIGRYCSIARGVEIGLQQHPTTWLSSSCYQYLPNYLHRSRFLKGNIVCVPNKEIDEEKTRVKIGNDVWIGNGAKIMEGLEIGDGAIVAAGAVVTKNVPPYAIVGGVPAKVIKYRFDEDTIRELLELKWWRYDIAAFGEVPWNNIKQAIKIIKERIAGGAEVYEAKRITAKDLTVFGLLKRIFVK